MSGFSMCLTSVMTCSFRMYCTSVWSSSQMASCWSFCFLVNSDGDTPTTFVQWLSISKWAGSYGVAPMVRRSGMEGRPLLWYRSSWCTRYSCFSCCPWFKTNKLHIGWQCFATWNYVRRESTPRDVTTTFATALLSYKKTVEFKTTEWEVNRKK